MKINIDDEYGRLLDFKFCPKCGAPILFPKGTNPNHRCQMYGYLQQKSDDIDA